MWFAFHVGLAILIALTTFVPFIALIGHIHLQEALATSQDPFFWHVLKFTVTQALCSAGVSIICALGVARALARRSFWGRSLLLRFFDLSLVIPVIVVIFGVVKVHGQQGLLTTIYKHFSVNVPDYLYGLAGIVFVHCCLNIPFASRVFLAQLEQIPATHWRIASQFYFSDWAVFKYLDWPCLRKQIIALFALIFFLCFTSFTVVLTLGGGPRATTLEVAIYHALHLDFDLQQAGLYAFCQFSLCAVGIWLFSRGKKITFLQTQISTLCNAKLRLERDQLSAKMIDVICLGLIALLYLPPLLAIIYIPIKQNDLWHALQNHALWHATGKSFIIAVFCGALSVLLSLLLCFSQCRMAPQVKIPQVSSMILLIPTIVLTTGWFALLHQQINLFKYGLWLVCWLNVLMALPFIHPFIQQTVSSQYQRYHKLTQSLGLTNSTHWRLVDWPVLKKPLRYAFSLACLLSIGDMSAIAFFHHPELETLPWLLYQQLGHYQHQAAHITATLLILFCLFFLTVIQNMPLESRAYAKR